MANKEEMQQLITKQPSTHYGLLWRPHIEGLNHVDHFGFNVNAPVHWSQLNNDVLFDTLTALVNPKLIVEIGVDAPFHNSTDEIPPSSTRTILNWKPDSCVYIGIDVADKSHLNNPSKNIYTLQNSSIEKHKLYDLMEQLGLFEIDFMFVDGYHSINEVLWEWEYWEKMAPYGVMAFHDTNSHPGPIAVLDATDKSIFDVTYYGEGELDWGIGVVKRIRDIPRTEN